MNEVEDIVQQAQDVLNTAKEDVKWALIALESGGDPRGYFSSLIARLSALSVILMAINEVGKVK